MLSELIRLFGKRRDFAYILVERFACRGASFHEQRACLVELTFSVNPNFSDAEVAATILHEAMHARLHPGSDEDIAPVIDPLLAAQRIAEVDRGAT